MRGLKKRTNIWRKSGTVQSIPVNGIIVDCNKYEIKNGAVSEVLSVAFAPINGEDNGGSLFEKGLQEWFGSDKESLQLCMDRIEGHMDNLYQAVIKVSKYQHTSTTLNDHFTTQIAQNKGEPLLVGKVSVSIGESKNGASVAYFNLLGQHELIFLNDEEYDVLKLKPENNDKDLPF